MEDYHVKRHMHYSPNLTHCIETAINERLCIEIEYESNEREVTRRVVEPIRLIFNESKRQLAAYCRLREDFRVFRLDRMAMAKIVNQPFEMKVFPEDRLEP